jgi:hypothetical protein
MKARRLTAAVSAVAAAVAAGVMWTAPLASAGTPFCDSLGKPDQIRECNCGFDFVPSSQDYRDCLAGRAVAPAPPQP